MVTRTKHLTRIDTRVIEAALAGRIRCNGGDSASRASGAAQHATDSTMAASSVLWVRKEGMTPRTVVNISDLGEMMQPEGNGVTKSPEENAALGFGNTTGVATQAVVDSTLSSLTAETTVQSRDPRQCLFSSAEQPSTSTHRRVHTHLASPRAFPLHPLPCLARR
ncbi:hypothetical protein EDB87DRAFT_21096 [Lactarius vividus]|nr:hypothetical protein EDB87DRAFT_21096 [Lactarius vividus]